ncbi:MAG: DSD1 family PLP-dependent enzyme [Acidobacteriota bacterium]
MRVFGNDDLPVDKNDLLTPCLLLDIDAVDRNIRKMAGFFANRPCKLRPHVKTHKSPWIAHRQVRAGAVGITCAKLEDARLFVEAGLDHVLIANEVVGARKIRELVGLAKLADIIVCVDQYENAVDLSEAAAQQGIRLKVLVEVDVGLGRCGVPSGQPAVDLVCRIGRLPGLFFQGLMGYEGGVFIDDEAEKRRIASERANLLVRTKEAVEKSGFPVGIASAGGSNTYQLTGRVPGITEVQAGSYVTMDDWNRRYGIEFEQAISVLSTVTSRPASDRLITDAGIKSLSTDHGFPRIKHEGLEWEAANEEHGRLRALNGSISLQVGEKLEIIPSHGCTTIPLFASYVAVSGGRVVGLLPIVSRGAVY